MRTQIALFVVTVAAVHGAVVHHESEKKESDMEVSGQATATGMMPIMKKESTQEAQEASDATSPNPNKDSRTAGAVGASGHVDKQKVHSPAPTPPHEGGMRSAELLDFDEGELDDELDELESLTLVNHLMGKHYSPPPPPAPEHCQWSSWTEGDCDATCGPGNKKYKREVKFPARHGGNPCGGDDEKSESCNAPDCTTTTVATTTAMAGATQIGMVAGVLVAFFMA